MLTLKEKRKWNSRGYITKLDFDQHSDSNSAEKSRDPAHLESQLGKGPSQYIRSMGEISRLQFGISTYNPRMQTESVTNLWASCSSDFTSMCKTWNVVGPRAWLTAHLQHLSNLKFHPLPPVLSWCCRPCAQSSYCHSESGQCPGRLEARSAAHSAWSLKPKQDYLISLTINPTYYSSAFNNINS